VVFYCFFITQTTKQAFKYLSYGAHDGIAIAAQLVHRLINEKYPKLLDLARERAIWLAEEIVQVRKDEEAANMVVTLSRFIIAVRSCCVSCVSC